MGTVTVKGQVTIPKAVRDHLGLKPGSQVRFRRVADGSIVLEPTAKPAQTPSTAKPSITPARECPPTRSWR